MADDNNGPRPLGDRPEDHDPSLYAAPSSGTARSEWTASDERGALHEAPSSPISPLTEDAGAHASGRASTRAAEADGASESVQPAARRSLWPVAAGVIVGAIIGAGSAYAIYATQKSDDGALEQKVASLGSRLDALDQRPDPQQAIAGLKSSISGLDGKVADAQKSAAAAGETANKAEQTARDAASKPPPAAFDPAPLEQKIATLQAGVDGLKAQAGGGKDMDGKIGALQAAIDDLRKQDSAQGDKLGTVQSAIAELKTQDADQGGKIAAFAATAAGLQSLQGKVAGVEKQAAATQDGVTTLQGSQKALEGKVREPAFAVVADSLVQQITLGEPYALQVDALASLNADAAKIAVLRENAAKGVPSAQVLDTQFKPLADAISAVEYKAPANASILDRLSSGMSSLVSVRSSDTTGGTGVASRVSTIEADLQQGDVIGASTTWNALPPDAKAKSQAWGALAKTSAEALTAARALRQQAIATLGGKKS